MCGIAAILSPRTPIDVDLLESATRTLHHRGPDARRHWIAPHGGVGLGHARLSIIDLASGDQPLSNEDGSLHLVVNGEFYGFEAIRERLCAAGHRFKTGSDSEIALHLFEDRGIQCLRDLRGEFAFVLWDERNRTLFAARDRFGIKPLYYAFHDGQLRIASEVKALFALGAPARWDREALYDYTRRVMLPGHTLYAGVQELPPGHYLRAAGGQVQVLPYWDFDYPLADPIRDAAPEASILRMRAVLDEAVRLRLRADVPVACYLSGGLDSCAVLGVASQHASRPIQAFTLRFDDEAYDEGAIAQEMAAKAGADFCPIDIRAEHLAEAFGDAIYHAERPIVNGHVVAKFLLSRAVRDAGVKVVLTGEGSDEIFGGYAHFRRDMILYNRQGQRDDEVAGLLAALEKGNQVSQGLLLADGRETLPPELAAIQARLGYAPSIFDIWHQGGEAFAELLAPDFLAEFSGRNPYRALLDCFDVDRQMAGRDPVHQSLYIWSKTILNGYILSNLGDRMEMGHSVEGRLPFMDHKLVEAVVQMPVAHKIHGMTEKWVLREAARPVLTDTVYRRQKHPFLSPPSTLQPDGALHHLLQDTLRSRTLDDLGIASRAKVVSLLDSLATQSTVERIKHEPVLMSLMSLCVLQERFHLR